jgi:uncharacterized membrane protein
MIFLCAFLVGLVSGLRTLLAPAAVSWAARLGMLSVASTPLAFMGFKYTPIILTVLAVVELITDQLPSTPSRKVPMQFGARIVSGALVGATVGASNSALVVGLILGIVGAIVGTLGGAAARSKMAAAFGKDTPAALIEDVVAILIVIFAVTRLS